MAKSIKEQDLTSLNEILDYATTMVINTPKTVQLDHSIYLRLKNIVTDFPEQDLSHVKLMNTILDKWLDKHREELMLNHLSKSSKRY